MVHFIPVVFLSVLLSAAACATAVAVPQAQQGQGQGQGQVVLMNSPAAPSGAARAPAPDPDFVDALQAEADRAGVTFDWGLDHVAQKANEAAFKASKLAHKHSNSNNINSNSNHQKADVAVMGDSAAAAADPGTGWA